MDYLIILLHWRNWQTRLTQDQNFMGSNPMWSTMAWWRRPVTSEVVGLSPTGAVKFDFS